MKGFLIGLGAFVMIAVLAQLILSSDWWFAAGALAMTISDKIEDFFKGDSK